MNTFDFLIVGAGFSGCTLAERLSRQANMKVLVVERRGHVGGNAHDYYNNDGILVHKYGPHYFRTNSKRVWDYLSLFTEWHYVQYRILAYLDGQYLNLPINLNTYNQLYGTSLSSFELEKIFTNRLQSSESFGNSEQAIIAKVGEELFEKFYKNYTKKQWDLWPSQLDASVCGRIPVRINRDDRYFTDRYQAMPKHGYNRMFERMLDHKNVNLMLQTDYRDIKDLIPHKKLIYTGPLDEFFDCRHGRLPYRSLRFEHETIDREFYQPVSQINYPNDYDFTRIVEIKHVTGQIHHKTTIVREYPESSGEPFYPIPTPHNRAIFKKYQQDTLKLDTIIFSGRLAEYKYLNMDQVVANALDRFERIDAETA
jgi:UDP-galactopyranose mutase